MGADRRRRSRRRPSRHPSSPTACAASTSPPSPPTSTTATTSSSSTPTRSCSPARSTPTRSTTGTPATPAASRSAPRASCSKAASPSACVEKAVERMIPRGPLGRRQMKNLRVYAGSEHPHVAQQPETLDVARAERQEQEERLIMAELNSLADLGSRRCRRTAGRSGPRPEARRPGPRLCHRQAQERHRPRLGQAAAPARSSSTTRNSRPISPVRCCR